jgi:hypothetical protein
MCRNFNGIHGVKEGKGLELFTVLEGINDPPLFREDSNSGILSKERFAVVPTSLSVKSFGGKDCVAARAGSDGDWRTAEPASSRGLRF